VGTVGKIGQQAKAVRCVILCLFHVGVVCSGRVVVRLRDVLQDMWCMVTTVGSVSCCLNDRVGAVVLSVELLGLLVS
jgi:hypothetical protein